MLGTKATAGILFGFSLATALFSILLLNSVYDTENPAATILAVLLFFLSGATAFFSLVVYTDRD